MDEKTKEDIAIAITMGIISSIVTFFARRITEDVPKFLEIGGRIVGENIEDKDLYTVFEETLERLHKAKEQGLIPKGYSVYVYGSLVRALRGRGEFKPSSDIDIFIQAPIGKDWLGQTECEKIAEAMGGEIKGHKIHVFSGHSLKGPLFEIKDKVKVE